MKVKIMRLEPCSWCGGYGVRMYGEDVDSCHECGGGGMVEMRDERGRFVPWEEVEVEDEETDE